MSQLKYYNGSSWVPAIVGAQGINGVQGIQGIQGSTGSNNYGWSTIATGTATSGNVISVSGISSLYANGEFEFVFPSPTTSTATSAYLTINGDTGTYFLKASQGQTLYANTSVIGASNISNSFVVKIWGASDSPKVVMYSSSVSAYQTWIYVPPTNVAITSLSLTLTTGTFTGGTWYLRARP